MNKKAVSAISIAVLAGALFLQAMVAGGVASTEMGMVMDAMRVLLRSDYLYYELNSINGAEETKEKIWVDMISGSWVEELTVSDDDGVSVSWLRYSDGTEEWWNYGQTGWEPAESVSRAPGLSVITDFALGVNAIADTQVIEEEDGSKEIIFTLADEMYEKHKEEMLDLLGKENDDEKTQSVTYQQYLDTSLDDASFAYKIDEEGALTEVDFSVDVTQPQILLKGAGTYELGNTTTRQMGYTTEIVSGKRGEVPEKIRQCQAQVEGL